MPEQRPATPILIVGGDSLALQVCAELMEFDAQHVTILWPKAEPAFVARVERCGATFVHGDPGDEDALLRAGVRDAFSIMLLTDDDHLNLEASLKARDLNPKLRIVMRQFNRTLGAKIEAKLPNCSVISVAAQSAATYATVAVDRACFYGVQFPDFTGPLFGFAVRGVGACGLGGMTLAEGERALGSRILAIDGELGNDRDRRLEASSEIATFGPVRSEPGFAKRSAGRSDGSGDARSLARRAWRAVRRTDPLVARVAVAALSAFVCASIFFAHRFQIDPVTATYYVMASMTTTGFGDIVPHPDDHLAQIVSMATMGSGTIFTAIFFAVLTSRFTQTQWRLQQGLRNITRRGHIVVCGAGNVGTRVVDFLVALGRQVVVIDLKPRSAIVDRSRNKEFDLLTGDATADSTLALCNLGAADALIALTESDTMNLEVALGAGQIDPELPVVLRMQEHAFASSISEHFGFRRTYGTAGLAAAVFAGLAFADGVRGFVTIAGREFSVSELTPDVPEDPGRVPLVAFRNGVAMLISSFDEVRPGDEVLTLFPAYKFRKATADATQRALHSHAGIRIDYAARSPYPDPASV